MTFKSLESANSMITYHFLFINIMSDEEVLFLRLEKWQLVAVTKIKTPW